MIVQNVYLWNLAPQPRCNQFTTWFKETAIGFPRTFPVFCT